MQETSHTSPFDAIRRVDERGQEYWSARELGKLLGYTTNYRNFKPAIEKAKEACKKSGYTVSDHFAEVRKMIATGKGAKRSTDAGQPSRGPEAHYLSLTDVDI